MAATIPVYDWLDSRGESFGLGTEAEFAHWRSEGAIADGARLGDVLGHEPAIEDSRRAAAWSA